MPQLMFVKTGEMVGDPEPGVFEWRNQSNHWKHSYISTPMSRAKVFPLTEARRIADERNDLVVVDPHGEYDLKVRK
jgi:hypothetical protein